MKPSPNDRRVCVIVRDFLVGLAVFFAIFTLALLDSRASRSAPAVVSNPAMTVRSAAPSAADDTDKISGGSWKPALALSSAVSGKSIAKFRVRQKITSPEARRYAGQAMGDGAAGAVAEHAPSRMNRIWLITVMALLFAAMTAITLGLWRHLRASVVPKRTARKVL